MIEIIAFEYNGRHYGISYSSDHRELFEWITPRDRTAYWRFMPPYGSSKNKRKEILGNRKKKDFIAMSIFHLTGNFP